MKKLIAIILVLALLPVTVYGANAGGSWLDALEEKSIRINGQTELFSGSYVNDGSLYSGTPSETLLAENYMIYTPGRDVTPLVCFGNDVAGAAGFSRIITLEEEAGNTVCAGVNGDFFTLATGVAMGTIIKDGTVCSSSRINYEALGFMADGSVVIGDPKLSVDLAVASRGIYYADLNFNKELTDSNGLVIYSSRYGADNGAGASRSVFVKLDEGADPIPGGSVTGVVETVEKNTSPVKLREGYLVLSVSETTKYQTVISAFESLTEGDEVTVTFNIDENWLDVKNAMGCERRLLADGKIAENIYADSDAGKDNTRAPRTAAGITADGRLVLYTADGRDSNHSGGFTYLELASRMKELGCREAVNLDGGASTQMYAVYPGEGSVSQVNRSSGSSVRRCADYLVLINRAEQTGKLAHISVYPYYARVLAGASLPLTLKGSDSGWYAAELGTRLPVWGVSSSRLGQVKDGVFIAGTRSGTATVSAYIGNASGSAEIEVVTRPDELNITYENGKTLPETIYVTEGGSVSLKASAVYKRSELIADDACFKWSVSSNLGTIENGVFTAAESVNGRTEGFINVTAGDVARSIPVTVYKDETPPVITGEVTDGRLSAKVIDADDPFFSKSCIEVTYDSKTIKFTYSDDGSVSAALPAGDGALHHLVITACDNMGNKSRLGIEVPTAALEGSPAYVPTFADQPADDPFTPYAEYLCRRGIMIGKYSGNDLIFDADTTLTRQEFAKVICNWLAFDLDECADIALPFTDQPLPEWSLPSIKGVYSRGYMLGKIGPGDTVYFDPKGTITRQEVVAVLARLMGEGYIAKPLPNSDASTVSAWALEYMQKVVTNGVIPEDELLRAKEFITRGELGRMMYALD